jgi:hypothetical protein
MVFLSKIRRRRGKSVAARGGGSITCPSWPGRIRTYGLQINSLAPYHLATDQKSVYTSYSHMTSSPSVYDDRGYGSTVFLLRFTSWLV